MFSKRRKEFEILLDRHPRVDWDVIGHIRESALDLDILSFRVETKESNGSSGRAEEIEEALDRGRFSCSFSAKESVTPAR